LKHFGQLFTIGISQLDLSLVLANGSAALLPRKRHSGTGPGANGEKWMSYAFSNCHVDPCWIQNRELITHGLIFSKFQNFTVNFKVLFL
jgi:hypothetical protein